MQKTYSKKQTTFFQERVCRAVKRIKRGKVSTYQEIARIAGFPRAYRAVGNLLKKNHNPEIPCHRVIRSDLAVGGYNGGIGRKIHLLEKEGIRIKDGRVVI